MRIWYICDGWWKQENNCRVFGFKKSIAECSNLTRSFKNYLIVSLLCTSTHLTKNTMKTVEINLSIPSYLVIFPLFNAKFFAQKPRG